MWRPLSLLLVLMLVAATVRAQLRLPGLPALPLPPPLAQSAVQNVAGSLAGVPVQGNTVVQSVQTVRAQTRALIRRDRAHVEADPDGNAMVRGELLLLSPQDADVATALAAGFSVVSDQSLAGLGMRVVALRVPAGAGTAASLTALQQRVPAAQVAFNHLYFRAGEEAVASAAPPAASAPGSTVAGGAAPGSAASGGSPSVPAIGVGLIDGGVDTQHPVFRHLSIRSYGCRGAHIVDVHGTEVASLLVGRAGEFKGAASGAALFTADVYCGSGAGGAIDAIADAFGWLAREHVAVINVSLVGPPNPLLSAVVQAMLRRGHLIVAAVGNDGPAAPPLYPASYPGVIGVTAVDASEHVLPEAARGPQVKFAAPGADMTAAVSPGDFALVRGTSFAAPIVAGLLAQQLRCPDPRDAALAVQRLAAQAIDPGAHGRPDPVFGYGVVGEGLRPQPQLAGVRWQ